MRRTSALDLVTAFVLAGVVTYFFLRRNYDSIPPLNYQIGLPVAGLAIGELIAARRVRLAVGHVPGAKLMAAIVIARCVALGKASALVGALLVGACAGVLVKVGPQASTVTAAANDLRAGLVLLATALLLLVAGVILERSGLIPRDPGATELHR
jgi:hypothetical protein